MEYVQERVTTLHDFRDPTPDAPTDRTAVVVPMTEREYDGLAVERVLSELEAVDPARVVVPLRASAEQVGPFADWLTSFELPVEVLWCGGPRLADLLADHGLDGERGKGRDVWLALGRATIEEYVVVHDADTKTYSRSDVPRLLFPLTHGHEFSKGYYARIEDNRLYGRLLRLFYAPLVRTLLDEHDAPLLRYLDAFRYALAGEFAATSDVARQLRVARTWGLEVSTLCDAFDAVGFDGSAQVDLGAYEHDHRSVGGPTGLSEMSGAVGATLFRALEEHGIDVDYATLPEQYREVAERSVEQYAVDAAFNGLDYDRDAETEQIESYATALRAPGTDTRLPAWDAVSLTPEAVFDAATEDLKETR
ncbi:glucosyl-3-phosphoglycerate synthase [Halogranum amylolyticum]|uniref:Glucosyl-3-phosphoglycerate synthase n=1 Tax=Halogranum amylolyticum TaxID=660520 RepID=A0A1H8PJD7_9EURY|nr:glycosyl transferase family 2 [Halogranum amylolyticum]SEO42139.1 glucosyl-3-phosphoglycerate synthase [Halogranum amylolyticum]